MAEVFARFRVVRTTPSGLAQPGNAFTFAYEPVVSGGGGGVGDLIADETPAGAVNGSNVTFTTANNFDPDTVELRINGLTQRKPTDFNTSGVNTLILTDSPLTGESVRVGYVIA